MPFKLSKIQIDRILENYLLALRKKFRNRPFEYAWSGANVVLSVICLALIFTYNPIILSTQYLYSLKEVKQTENIKSTFAFVPGSAPNKFDKIDLEGLDYLAFYDLPFNTDGTLNTEVSWYSFFFSDSANYLFHQAHVKNVKVLATLSLTYNPAIYEFLNNPQSQEVLFGEALSAVQNTGIDGVAVAVEFEGEASTDYKNRFTNFVSNFANYMHDRAPGSVVAVAVPDNLHENGLYNVKELANVSDKTFITAYDIAVPEALNNNLSAPVYSYANNEYKEKLLGRTDVFHKNAPEDKLVIERAWYGNGNNYRLHATNLPENNADFSSSLNANLNEYTINNLLSDVPVSARDAARRNLPHIVKALEEEKILNENVLAYAMATIQHETANTFEPIEEFKGRKSSRRLGYEGGTNYFGRGFIQLTHLRNYKMIGERIGMGDELVKNPDLALQADVAARILAAYFKDFGIAELATNGNFVDARQLINPDVNGYMIAQIAYAYLSAFV